MRDSSVVRRRHRVPFALIATALAAVCVARSDVAGLHQSASRINLLLVTLDTVRADHIGAYGSATAATPVLDRLAREGVRFADATTQSPLTGPAHAALMTGMYPGKFGVRDNAASRLPDEAVTLAERLKAAGYSTGAFIGAFILDRAFGFAQGFDAFDARFEGFGLADLEQARRRGDKVADSALAWLGGLPGDRPFFCWVHLYDAHAPYALPPPLNARFRGRAYDGEIAFVDQQVGRLVAAVQNKGWLDRTLVVAVADHGEGLGDHDEDHHGVFLYESVLRVPWVMRLPGRIGAGVVVQEQVRSIDLAPTVLDLLAVPGSGPLDGETLVPVLQGRDRKEVPPSFAETYYPRFHFGWSELRSVRTGDFKYIDAPHPELYAPVSDPGERQNLTETKPIVARRLSAMAQSIARTLPDADRAPRPQPDADTLARLRSLGYVGLVGGGGGARGPDPKLMTAQYRQFGTLIESSLAAIRGGRPATAVTNLKKALTINPRSYDVHLFLGDAYRQLGDPGNAGNPGNPGNLDRAVGEYEAAGQLNPGVAEPHLSAADIRIDQHDFDGARREISHAAAADARSYAVDVARGRLAEASGQLSDAMAAYQRAVSGGGGDPRPHALLANIALRLGRFDVAEREFNHLLDANYQPAGGHFGLGMIAEARGDRAAAVTHYRRAVALDPAFKEARQALARLTGPPKR
ncbi:MAG TPA: sulfatase-like hydrolase/transferase [Vicinamibacterales bacterium]|nr:sulfatase-like hydrolase/transferase [Vicinamibacterales bacterium]